MRQIRSQTRNQMISMNMQAFLTMIAVSEIGEGLLRISDNGYNVLVGATAKHPMLFASYEDHPRRLVTIKLSSKEWHSTAAGRYQLLARYFDHYRKLLHLNDFSPASQDEIAIQQMREKHALPDIEAGRFEAAIKKVRSLWASLPVAGYGQPENSLALLKQAFVRAGGQVQ